MIQGANPTGYGNGGESLWRTFEIEFSNEAY